MCMTAPLIVVFLALSTLGAMRFLVVPDIGADAAEVLAVLWQQARPMGGGEISCHTGMKPERIAAAVQHLEAYELVRRDKTQGEEDGDLFPAVRRPEKKGDDELD